MHTQATAARNWLSMGVALSAVALAVAACSSTNGQDDANPAGPAGEGGAAGESSGPGGSIAMGGTPAGGSTDEQGGSSVEAGASSLAGAAGAAGAGLDPLPPELIDAIETVKNGGQVDLDGDGVTDMETEVLSDRRISKVLQGGQVLLLVTRFTSGKTEKAGDFDLDGGTDYTELELATDAQFSRQTEQDRDFDGAVDWRETFELDVATGATHTLREVFDGAAWATEEDGTNEAPFVTAGTDCTEPYPYPAVDNSQVTELQMLGHVRVALCKAETSAGACITQAKGACTRAQLGKIQQELGNLFKDGIDELKPLLEVGVEDSSVVECLGRRQAPFLESLISNIATGTVSGRKGTFNGSRIACGVTCPAGTAGRTLAQTNKQNRQEVNLNMDQSAFELRDTLLHELIHSAGYDGPAGHSDDTGSTDDPIYACSAWCTGHSMKSIGENGTPVYDPNGKLDMHDCFRCSGTLAAKQECCGEKYVCQGGCCAEPCQPNGTCKTDPCDPELNRGDYSKCRFSGDSAFTTPDGGCTSHVDWVYDHFSLGKVILVATGSTVCTNPLQGSCGVTPLDCQIDGEGELTLDYNTDPPRYNGVGNTQWTQTYTCPRSPPIMGLTTSPWFMQEFFKPFTPFGNLDGKMMAEGGTLEWSWVPQ